MIISHDLNSNGYLINNEIWFTISADSPVVYYRIYLQNLSNGKISSTFTTYADINGKAYVNIQSVVKSMFDVPNGVDRNSAQIKITITSNDNTSINFTKSFIRGGKRTNDTNITISPNSPLRLALNIPVWLGFPITDYFLESNYSITTLELASINNIDYKRSKGCNNIYIKFLNQNGGYSYWLFESYSEKETGTSLGNVISSENNILDLGTESKSDLTIFSKIPREYKQYAKDIIVSQDIYAYQNASWKKIFVRSNSLEVDNVKKVYSVNLNLDLAYRFNPSLLWSN
jgi:hypothetical protein